MRLTRKAITEITSTKEKNLKVKNRLAYELDCSVSSVDRWLDANDNNGDLTKAKAVQAISEETGLAPEDILEEVSKEVA